MSKPKIKLRYFKSIHGKVVPRFGTERFIGCKHNGKDWEWSDKLVSIPASECDAYLVEYKRAIKTKTLIECNEKGKPLKDVKKATSPNGQNTEPPK